MKILIILPGFIPSTIIGVLRPLAELERRGNVKLRLRLYNIQFLIHYDIDWCDVAVFCRNCEIKDLPVLYALKHKDKKIVYEIDDNFEEIPLDTDIGRYHRAFFRLHVLKRFFSLADITRVYSPRLAEKAISHGAHVQLNRSYFDTSLIDGLSKKPANGIIKIAYPTNRIDDKKLEDKIFSAIKIVLEKYPEKVEFHLWRKALPDQLWSVKGVVLQKGVRNYESFIQSFFQVGFDIGIAPGNDTPFFHSKTNNKYREFGGCGIAGIYCNFPPYSNSVIHEYSGLLVDNSIKEWVAAIERLILNDKLRTEIIRNAQSDVFANYSFENAINSWKQCLELFESQKVTVIPWLYHTNTPSIFAYVHTRDPRENKRCYKHLRLAVNHLPYSKVVEFAHVTKYMQSPILKSFAATIISVSNKNEMATVKTLLPLSNYLIVDLTKYSNNIDRPISYLRSVAPTKSITFIISYKKNNLKIRESYNSQFYLVNDQISNNIQMFSLTGYPAIYMDVLEHHIHHSQLMMPSYSKKDKFFSLKKNSLLKILKPKFILIFFHSTTIKNLYYIWQGRFITILTFIKFRLGYRHF